MTELAYCDCPCDVCATIVEHCEACDRECEAKAAQWAPGCLGNEQ